MTFKAAAERVLRTVGKPLHSYEIVEYALKRGWVVSSGKTPHHTLQVAIWSDIKKNGSKSRFRMIGKGKKKRKFWLHEAG
jgi:restriction system protein